QQQWQKYQHQQQQQDEANSDPKNGDSINVIEYSITDENESEGDLIGHKSIRWRLKSEQKLSERTGERVDRSQMARTRLGVNQANHIAHWPMADKWSKRANKRANDAINDANEFVQTHV
ncbi:hypothetical protein RDWZM_008156, partial [Blomia tropicalis]